MSFKMDELNQVITSDASLDETLLARAKEISKANGGVKVIPLRYVCPVKGDAIVGFLKEPNRVTSVNLIGKIMENTFLGGSLALSACLMKDVSDSRIWSEDPEYNTVYYGACMDAAELFQIAINQVKKK